MPPPPSKLTFDCLELSSWFFLSLLEMCSHRLENFWDFFSFFLFSLYLFLSSPIWRFITASAYHRSTSSRSWFQRPLWYERCRKLFLWLSTTHYVPTLTHETSFCLVSVCLLSLVLRSTWCAQVCKSVDLKDATIVSGVVFHWALAIVCDKGSSEVGATTWNIVSPIRTA